MARIRTIKPEFPHSESMGNVSRESRLCFIMLWTIADDSGRLRGNSRMLASLLFPYDNDAAKLIDGWLDQLVKEKCIVRYEVDGQHYVEICNWSSHQKIDKPTASKLPPPANIREDSTIPREDSSEEGNGMDQGMEGSGKDSDDGRHKYGTENNVLLTDAQYQKFLSEMPQAALDACIDELSTSKAMKGYKYKRDDLAMRKWVIDKVKAAKPELFKPQKPAEKSQMDLAVEAMIKREYAERGQNART